MPGKQSFPGILPFMGVFSYVQVFIPVSKPIFIANLKYKNLYVEKSTGYLIRSSKLDFVGTVCACRQIGSCGDG